MDQLAVDTEVLRVQESSSTVKLLSVEQRIAGHSDWPHIGP
jgi:hypothetical protein